MKLTHFFNIVFGLVIIGLLVFGWFKYDEYETSKTTKDSKIEEISGKLENAESEKNKLAYKLEIANKKVAQLNLELSSKENNKILEIKPKFEVVENRKEIFKSEIFKPEAYYLNNKDKMIYASQLRNALNNLKKNQYILVEGHTDDLMFVNDIENKKNIKLAFNRVIKNLITLTEKEINQLQFKINTLSNERRIKIYLVTWELKN